MPLTCSSHAAPGVQDWDLDDAPPDTEQRGDIAGDEGGTQGERQSFDAIRHDAAAFFFVEASAKTAGINCGIADNVSSVDATEHHRRDRDGDDTEQTLQNGLRHKLRRDAPEKTPRRGCHLEQHPESQVHQLTARALRRNR